MIISEKTKQRIFEAMMEGWCFRSPKEPFGEFINGHFTNRGSIWISPPDKLDEWRGYKSDTKQWLDDCLDEAGVKGVKDGNK